MASTSSVFGQVIHFVYTWLPKTAKNIKGKKKGSRQCKKRVNFSQPLNDKSETSSTILAFLESSHGLPSTPNASKVLILRSLPKGQAELSEEFSSCNLEVVGCKFLSNEKKMSKRSALKRWLRKKTNDVHEENIDYDGQFNGARHYLCSKEVFECSPKLDGKELTENIFSKIFPLTSKSCIRCL